MKRGALGFKIILLLVATGCALVAAEVVLRLKGDAAGGYKDVLEQRAEARGASRYRAHDDPELLYVLRPDFEDLTNGQGILADEDFTMEKPAGVRRIVVLGDSISAGFGLRVRGEAPYPVYLDRLLAEKPLTPEPVQVLNFSADGYSTRQEARLLELVAGKFDPDLIVLQFCANDGGSSYTPAVWFVDETPPKSFLLNRALAVLGIRDTASRFDPAHPMYAPEIGEMWEKSFAPGAEQWRGFEEGFATIAAYADERSIPVVLVMFPLLVEQGLDRDRLMPRILKRVGDEAKKNGFHTVNLAVPLADTPVTELREVPGDLYHVNDAAHREAAEVIYGLLKLRDLLVKRENAGADEG